MLQVYPCKHVLSLSNDTSPQNGWSRIARRSVRALWLGQVRPKLKTSDWRRQGTKLNRVEKIHEPQRPRSTLTWRHVVDGIKWQYFVKTVMVFWFLGAFAKLRTATNSSSYLSVCLSEWNTSVPPGQIFMKFDIRDFFETLLRKFNFHENLTIITDTLYEGQQTIMIILRSVFLSMRNVSGKFVEKFKTHV